MLQLLQLNPVLSRAVIGSLLRKRERKGEVTTKNCNCTIEQTKQIGVGGKQ